MREKKKTSQDLKNDKQKIIVRLVPDSEKYNQPGKKTGKKRKGQLYKKRTHEPNENTLKAEIAVLKTIEETWGDSVDEMPTKIKGKTGYLIIIFFLVIIIVAGWSLLNSFYDQSADDASLAKINNEFEKNETQQYSIKDEIKIASKLIDHYLKASTANEKSKYIYQAGVFKHDIQAYYEKNQLAPILNYHINGVLPITINGEEILEVVIKKKDEISETIRSYYVRQDIDGLYKIDWKADVNFQDNNIIDFKESRSKTATSFKFEVKRISYIKTFDWAFKNPDFTMLDLKAPYSDQIFWGLESRYQFGAYNWGFKDTEYSVFRLNIPNSNLVFWGYLKKGSPEEEKLYRLIEENLKMRVLHHQINHEFILKVRFLEDSPIENDQYIFIEDIISQRWINTDE